MMIKYKAITKEPKSYLKRMFVLDYLGGFVGYHRRINNHELPNNARELFFEADDRQEYMYESTVKDGHYFDCFIEHYDKHGKLNHTEQLKPIKVE